MPVAMPKTIRKVWGEEASEDFLDWFEDTLEEKTVVRDEYRQVLSRLDILERDVAEVRREVSVVKTDVKDLRGEMNERFDRMNERFDAINARMDVRFDKVNERFDQMYDRIMVMTRWTVGTLVLFGTMITILIAIQQFAP